MSEPSKPSIWSIKPKKKPPTASSATASGSSRPYKRDHDKIKEEDEDEDEDLQDIFKVGRKAEESRREIAKLEERRRKKARRGLKDEDGDASSSSNTTVSIRNVRSSETTKLSRSDRLALVSSAELIERTLKKFAARRGQTEQEYQQDIAKLRSCIQLLPFLPADRGGVRSSSIATALGKLTSEENEDLRLPVDIVLDAKSLLTRWRNEDFDREIMRGIQTSQKVTRGSGGGVRNTKRTTHYKLEDNYLFKKNPHVPGHNGLIIGDWWPLQICALRDGAHGEMEAGISGNKEHGCLSVIVSNGYSQDEDNGNSVLYCGTLGSLAPSEEPYNAEEKKISSPGIASANTNLLRTSMEKETPIRLLRSYKSKGKSEYAPREGIRYDGLYKVKGYEILDEAYAMYRFQLEREPGQADIRYKGPGVRPNEIELGDKGWGGVKNIMKGER